MSWRSGGVLVLTSLLLLTAAACTPGSNRDQGSASSPATPSTTSSTKPSPAGKTTKRDPKSKPQADAAKASPGGFTVRYLKDGKISQVDVTDFDR